MSSRSALQESACCVIRCTPRRGTSRLCPGSIELPAGGLHPLGPANVVAGLQTGPPLHGFLADRGGGPLITLRSGWKRMIAMGGPAIADVGMMTYDFLRPAE